MKIAFTGHRDCFTPESELDRIRDYPLFVGATWVNGGAPGFDKQVTDYARANHIPIIIVRPDYKTYPYRVAPLIRNKEIVDMSDVVVACYDGRGHGGTLYTRDYATKTGKFVNYVTCIHIDAPIYDD